MPIFNKSDVRLPEPGIPFPSGIPGMSGGCGMYINEPGKLPVLHLFKDYDLFLIVGGEATWSFSNGVRMVVPKGYFAVMPPFTPAWIEESKAILVLQYCHFDFRTVSSNLNQNIRASFDGPGEAVLLPMTFPARSVPKAAKAYRKLMALREGRPQTPWRLEMELLEVVGQLARFAEKQSARKRLAAFANPAVARDARVERIREKIDADPAQAWSVAELAAAEDLTPGHLHSLCRSVLGGSLKSYMVEAKLRMAVRLLKMDEHLEVPTVREVSEACGFSSQHYFSRQFKGRFGVGPLAYRNGATIE